MRENLERVLQFMASKKIRMHQISSREILEGNLKAVMRLILALAAHYKPQSVKHHDVSYDNVPELGGRADKAGADQAAAQTQGEMRWLSLHYHQNSEYKLPGPACPGVQANSTGQTS